MQPTTLYKYNFEGKVLILDTQFSKLSIFDSQTQNEIQVSNLVEFNQLIQDILNDQNQFVLANTKPIEEQPADIII